MINLIVKRFVKNSEDTKNPDVRSAVGRLCGWIGILCNVFLFGIKFVIGIIVNSVSIQADAINNLTDAGSNIIAIFSFYLSNKLTKIILLDTREQKQLLLCLLG